MIVGQDLGSVKTYRKPEGLPYMSWCLFLNFVLRILDLFRISKFEFRIWELSKLSSFDNSQCIPDYFELIQAKIEVFFAMLN